MTPISSSFFHLLPCVSLVVFILNAKNPPAKACLLPFLLVSITRGDPNLLHKCASLYVVFNLVLPRRQHKCAVPHKCTCSSSSTTAAPLPHPPSTSTLPATESINHRRDLDTLSLPDLLPQRQKKLNRFNRTELYPTSTHLQLLQQQVKSVQSRIN